MSATEVRQSFLEQADWCRRLASPFTARLCEALAASLDTDTEIGREILDWRGNPFPKGDALALRVAGALHALARGDSAPGLSRRYPPAPLPDTATMWPACREAFVSHPAHFRKYLAVAPQTNEVGRSAVLMAGFLEFARRFDVPLHLFEIGASAGLNLIPDRYRYRFGAARWGDERALLDLAPEWIGNPPAVDARFLVASRQGTDIAPLDISLPAQRAVLMSYAWADQSERLRRLEAAIISALVEPTKIAPMEAAEWVENRLPPDATRSGGRVLFHSVVWQYLPQQTQARITARAAACGAAANRSQPFGWLRFELDESAGQATLVMTAWPGGDTVMLATSHPHGRTVNYLL